MKTSVEFRVFPVLSLFIQNNKNMSNICINHMSNLDDSIGKILLDLQKDDPDTFKKLMKKAQLENPELFNDSIESENAEIDDYNRKIDDYNNKIDKE